jgi:hypothetical protein
MEYTVFYDQRNRINFQVLADNEREALKKGDKLYERLELPLAYAQEGWIIENDGEDK